MQPSILIMKANLQKLILSQKTKFSVSALFVETIAVVYARRHHFDLQIAVAVGQVDVWKALTEVYALYFINHLSLPRNIINSSNDTHYLEYNEPA